MSWFGWLISLTFTLGVLPVVLAEKPSTIVIEENFPPFSYVDEHGPNGYSHAVLHELSTRLQWQVPIQFSPWGRAERELLSNHQMLLASMMKTPARESHYLWVAKLYEQPVHIYRLKKRADSLVVSTLDDLTPFIIGTQIGSASSQLLLSAGVPERNIDLVASFQQNLHKARIHRIDFFTMPPAVLRHLVGSKQLVESEFEPVLTLIGPRSFYLVASLQFSPVLTEQIRSTIHAMEREGTIMKLRQNYGID